MNEVELTVMEIDKAKKERNHLRCDECLYMTLCGCSILGGAILATASLGATFALWGVAMVLKKFGFNSARSLASERNDTIAEKKKTITYEDYIEYHEPCGVTKQFRKIKDRIKYGRRYGFADSRVA